MEMSRLIGPEAIAPDFRAAGKEAALHELARRVATLASLDSARIFNSLADRERLGSTGIGHGVAIPHARIAGLDRIVGLFARADRPIAFDSIDGRPVDLFFVLLIPPGEGGDHLAALACVARRLRDRETAERLRQGKDAAALYAALLG